LTLKNYLTPIAEQQKHSFQQRGGYSTRASSGIRKQKGGREVVSLTDVLSRVTINGKRWKGRQKSLNEKLHV